MSKWRKPVYLSLQKRLEIKYLISQAGTCTADTTGCRFPLPSYQVVVSLVTAELHSYILLGR